jgi:hypothetical protein
VRRSGALLLVIACIACACGGSATRAAYQPDAKELVQSICGTLKVRLESIVDHTVFVLGGPLHPPASYHRAHFEQGARESAQAVTELASEASALELPSSKRYLRKLLRSLLAAGAYEFSEFEARTRSDFPYRGGSARPPKRALNEYEGLVLSVLLACRKAIP